MTDWRIEHGNCIEVMAAMPEASIDAIVCDPPYCLGFMGRGGTNCRPVCRGLRRDGSTVWVPEGAGKI